MMRHGPFAHNLQQMPCKPKAHFTSCDSTRWCDVSTGSSAIKHPSSLSALGQMLYAYESLIFNLSCLVVFVFWLLYAASALCAPLDAIYDLFYDWQLMGFISFLTHYPGQFFKGLHQMPIISHFAVN